MRRPPPEGKSPFTRHGAVEQMPSKAFSRRLPKRWARSLSALDPSWNMDRVPTSQGSRERKGTGRAKRLRRLKGYNIIHEVTKELGSAKRMTYFITNAITYSVGGRNGVTCQRMRRRKQKFETPRESIKNALFGALKYPGFMWGNVAAYLFFNWDFNWPYAPSRIERISF